MHGRNRFDILHALLHSGGGWCRKVLAAPPAHGNASHAELRADYLKEFRTAPTTTTFAAAIVKGMSLYEVLRRGGSDRRLPPTRAMNGGSM